MMYNVGVIACDGTGLTKEMKEILSLFFPCHYFFQVQTNIEVALEEYFKKTEIKYTVGSFSDTNILIIFWDKKDERCKNIINNAHKSKISIFIYYI